MTAPACKKTESPHGPVQQDLERGAVRDFHS